MPSLAYLSYDRFPAAKGAAVHIAAFAGALGERYGDVDLVTVAPHPGVARAGAAVASPGGGEPCFDDGLQAALPGVRCHGFQAIGANLIERVLAFRAQLRAWWGDRRFDIVHVRSIYEGYPVARNKSRVCRKLVAEINGLPSIELKYHYPEVADDAELLRKLRGQEDALLAAADLILTVSDVNAAHLRSRGVAAEKLRVIPNGVDVELFGYRRPQRWPLREPRVLYCGTLAPWQGVTQALEALALYCRDAPARLIVAGDGRSRHRSELCELARRLGIEARVEWRGPVSQSGVAALHHDADVVVAPLRDNDRNRKQGCCPLKVLEAMASGTPLIASDLEVVRELARSGREAILVRPGSPKAIKDGLLRLQSDPHLAPQISAAARRRVKQRFTWRLARERLIAAYEELLG